MIVSKLCECSSSPVCSGLRAIHLVGSWRAKRRDWNKRKETRGGRLSGDKDKLCWDGPMISAATNAGRRFFSAMANEVNHTFAPKRLLIVSKTTRYAVEMRRNNVTDDNEMAELLKRRGTDAERLFEKHKEHCSFLEKIQHYFQQKGVETRTVERSEYTPAAVAWADAIFSAGGDGTFLLAASQVFSRDKPVIGINTDPSGSEGHMCMLRKEPWGKVKEAMQTLWSGDFEWLFRQRIRVSVTAEGGVGESMQSLHSSSMNRDPSTSRWEGLHPHLEDSSKSSRRRRSRPERKTEQLPVLALNEVFVGESLSSRVSYYQLRVDGSPPIKQKSSGLTVSTGTGSTSWFFNINKMTTTNIEQILEIAAVEMDAPSLRNPSPALVERIRDDFNNHLTFSPELKKMAFSVRDPIFNSTFPPSASREFADEIYVKSRGFDAHLVVDGGVSFAFNDGAEATMRVLEDDALRTVIFR